MPICPQCGSEVKEPMKTWKMKSPKHKTETEVSLFACSNCGKKFRKAKKID